MQKQNAHTRAEQNNDDGATTDTPHSSARRRGGKQRINEICGLGGQGPWAPLQLRAPP